MRTQAKFLMILLLVTATFCTRALIVYVSLVGERELCAICNFYSKVCFVYKKNEKGEQKQLRKKEKRKYR